MAAENNIIKGTDAAHFSPTKKAPVPGSFGFSVTPGNQHNRRSKTPRRSMISAALSHKGKEALADAVKSKRYYGNVEKETGKDK